MVNCISEEYSKSTWVIIQDIWDWLISISNNSTTSFYLIKDNNQSDPISFKSWSETLTSSHKQRQII